MRKIILPILIITLILFGISFYLQSIDHSTKVIVTKNIQTTTTNINITQEIIELNKSILQLTPFPVNESPTQTLSTTSQIYVQYAPEIALAIFLASLGISMYLSPKFRKAVIGLLWRLID
jgi:hypothetical protein